MFSVRKAISRAFLPISMAYDLVELYVYCLLVFAWLLAVFFGLSAPCGSPNEQFYSVQENHGVYEDEAMLEPIQIVVPPVREAIEELSEVDDSHEPHMERLARTPATYGAIHLEVPLVIEDVAEQFLDFGFASNNGSDMSISSLSSVEIVDTPTPSPGGNKRGEREAASRDLSSTQLRPLLLSTQAIEPRNKRAPVLRVDAPAFVPASRSSPDPAPRRASGSENVPLPPSAYWNPPPNSALPVISVPYKRPRRRGGRTPVISEREIRDKAARSGTKALQPANI